MYITPLERSPWENIVSFGLKFKILLDMPEESRKDWALKSPPFLVLFALATFISSERVETLLSRNFVQASKVSSWRNFQVLSCYKYQQIGQRGFHCLQFDVATWLGRYYLQALKDCGLSRVHSFGKFARVKLCQRILVRRLPYRESCVSNHNAPFRLESLGD